MENETNKTKNHKTSSSESIKSLNLKKIAKNKDFNNNLG